MAKLAWARPAIAAGVLALALLGILLKAALTTQDLQEQSDEFDMPGELLRLANEQGVWDDQWNRHAEKAQALRNRFETTRDPLDRIDLRRQIAEQDLYSGHAEAAVAELEALIRELKGRVPAPYMALLQRQLARAYLRYGEKQNCLENPAAGTCVFPIDSGGVHKRRLGAQQAISQLSALLRTERSDPLQVMADRWLLNIAFMALGQYPDEVPPAWLIPPSSFESSADIGRFPDGAATAGVDVMGLSGGAILDDFNGDGHLDVVASSWGLQDQLEFFIGDGQGSFLRQTIEAGLGGITGGLNINQADYDNDGDPDILILRGAWRHERGRYPNSLLRNDGGRFVDVTQSSGLLSYFPTATAAWADFDNDGWLDLFIGNEIDRKHVKWEANAKDFELYRNLGDGRFQEISKASGIAASGMIKGCTWGDIDNDGDVDLYISIWGHPNHLYRNIEASGRFENVAADAGVAEPLASFPTWFWDYDNDGWLDLFVAGYQASLGAIAAEALDPATQPPGARPRLYRNRGNGRFEDRTPGSGLDRLLLAMGANHGDFDNDGWPDLLIGTGSPQLDMLVPNRAFRNDGGLRFEDITTSGGFGHLQKGHGVAFGDIDHDGDQDVYAVIGGAFEDDRFWNALYRNPGHGNDWITLRLAGVTANRMGVGARVKVSLTSGRSIHALGGTGGSFGASSLQQEIGLGSAAQIQSIEIQWPGESTAQILTRPIQVNRRYDLRQGEGLVPTTD